MSYDYFITLLGMMTLASPCLLLCLLGFTSLVNQRLSESTTSLACQVSILTGLIASIGILTLMLASGMHHESIELGNWVAIPQYHFLVKLVFDRLSIPMLILSFVLCGTIAAFGSRYMHRERGFNRFFFLYSMFVFGMVLTSISGTIETLFTGWELVGLSSALLVAYFHERQAPPRNGLRVWVVYRVSDAALLLAAIVMHHHTGEGDFDKLLGGATWPDDSTRISEQWTLIVGFLLIIAAAGKSALAPFSGWLPRAMEGPTPSSAIFYGALSVHLGAFLLLRVSPVIESSVWLSTTVIVLGLVTAILAYLAGSVQTDIKSVLSFASLVQVGIIVAEIGLGLRYIALIHLLGNACLRTFQFIRAPSMLHDYRQMEMALGEHLPASKNNLQNLVPRSVRHWLYRFALERCYLDAFLDTWIVQPFLSCFRWCDKVERGWVRLLVGTKASSTKTTEPTDGEIEKLP